MTSPIGFNIALTNVDARLKKRCINVVPTFRNVVSMFFLHFQRFIFFCFNFILFQRWSTTLKDPQRWNNVDPTLKCWLGYNPPDCNVLKEVSGSSSLVSMSKYGRKLYIWRKKETPSPKKLSVIISKIAQTFLASLSCWTS